MAITHRRPLLGLRYATAMNVMMQILLLVVVEKNLAALLKIPMEIIHLCPIWHHLEL